MPKTLIIAKRELAGLFFSPVAYVALIVFSLVASLLFVGYVLIPTQPASMRFELTWIVWLLVFVVPALSMGLVSEERRSGTLELLMTSPVSDMHVIVGKWLGAFVFFLTLMVPLLVQVGVLEAVAAPQGGPIFTGLLGLVLVAGLYLAVGASISALTSNQFTALLITILITGFFTIGLYLLVQTNWVPGWLKEAMYYVNVDQQYCDFAKGLIDTGNFVFFISGTVLFLFLAVLVLQSRRWR